MFQEGLYLGHIIFRILLYFRTRKDKINLESQKDSSIPDVGLEYCPLRSFGSFTSQHYHQRAGEGRQKCACVWSFFQTQKLNIIAAITIATGSCRIVPFENHLGGPHLFSGCFVIVFRLFFETEFPCGVEAGLDLVSNPPAKCIFWILTRS